MGCAAQESVIAEAKPASMPAVTAAPINSQDAEVVVLRRLVAKLSIWLVVCAMAAGVAVGLTDPTASESGRAATAGTLSR